MGFTSLGEIFAYVTVLNPTVEVVTFRLRGWCMLGVFYVAGIRASRTWMPGSFESLWWNACVHRLDLGNGVWTYVNSKGIIPSTGKILPRGVVVVIIIIIIIIIMISVFLERLFMWNMLNCAEQVQIQKCKTHAHETLKTVGVQIIMLKHPTKHEKEYL